MTVIASVVRKKQWTRKTTGPYHRLQREEEEEERFDQEDSPSTKKLEEGARVQTGCGNYLTSSELRDIRKDYICQRGERIAAWLLQCWDNTANSQQLEGKWTTADEGIRYLRELAVLEVIYSDLDDDEVSKDPEDVLCTQVMWRKVIQSAPASYSNSLAVMYCLDMDT
ncbi:hypothetical protein GRJ2_000691300 [Grus japonensis]|uniref:Uncharacterized protein n=1 Tax=Grus japonensis TaxID=30415 RepID=A0ABC9W9N4_GRUJA